jgi:membrane protein implicated in regulation of membrane protease activity
MWARVIIGVVLCLTGVVWIGQGVGAIGGSFMTGHAEWAVAGAVALFLGAALLLGAQRVRRSRSEDDGS